MRPPARSLNPSHSLKSRNGTLRCCSALRLSCVKAAWTHLGVTQTRKPGGQCVHSILTSTEFSTGQYGISYCALCQEETEPYGSKQGKLEGGWASWRVVGQMGSLQGRLLLCKKCTHRDRACPRVLMALVPVFVEGAEYAKLPLLFAHVHSVMKTINTDNFVPLQFYQITKVSKEPGRNAPCPS